MRRAKQDEINLYHHPYSVHVHKLLFYYEIYRAQAVRSRLN